MRLFATFVILLGYWFLLSGEFTPIIIVLAVISSFIVSYLTKDLFFPEKVNIILILKIFSYVPWLFWQIVLANIEVFKILIKPKLDIDPSMVEFEPKVKSDIGITLLANSITLTPGTVTIFADRDHFFVHALGPQFAEGLSGGEMEKKILEIEKCL
ncbi:Na+/H+ antiporter subunit E [Calditerrivibrio nitroreducens]|uniref:Cation antiporter n=1 Tax=Calditerrivibrio nitroreducens (strain DSM 19672 / NBRC 101217 / Yu37-1) TaxID=768670 RepID=E4TF98_CALNY|nr:Na+/H+ antiporter subunit E [Calditerrivibrio nitroreducens]ADR18437.1 cation antiporter [Calditerrivibrio nitroreducens DSM 19672]